MRPTKILLLSTLTVLLPTLSVRAQQINLSLHATAVPDSFVVRATSTEGSWGAVPNAVFTLRWEVAAGGAMNNGDVRRANPAYTLLSGMGIVDIGNHRYFTLVLMGDRALEQTGAAITPAGMDIGGLRIRQLSGCRHVELVQNAYTGLNNLDYYFSVGGIPLTGQISSAPIPGGECGPCAPPVIVSASAVQVAGCNSPIELTMLAEGTAIDISWYGAYSGVPYSYQADHTIPSGPAGPFLLVVNGACGADSVVVPVSMADPSGCTPPEIASATYGFGLQSIGFHTSASGSCLQYVVVAPNGETYSNGSNTNVHVPNSAGIGEYLAISYNTCGADTVAFWIAEVLQCNPPQIVSTNAMVPACQVSPLTLSCSATGPGPIDYQWMDPFGTVVGTSANATVAEAMVGNYSITASNACAATWALVSVVLDTAGIGACVPPLINGLVTNGSICAGDTLFLEADAIAAGPCLNYQWSGANVRQSGGASTWAVATQGTYALTVSNACGSVSMSVQASVITQHNVMEVLCGPEGLQSLDSLTQIQSPITLPPGSWSWNGEPHADHYDPAVDTTGQYFYYHEGTGCPVVQLSIHEFEAVNAGADTAISVCSTDAPVALFPLLGAGAQPGGFWTIGIGMMNGVYDPAIHNSNTCRYTVINQGCNDQAVITVTEIPASAWYADGDGDGLGDPADELLACDAPDGYVANGEDVCPNVYGVIGDACDDGDPATVNDVIDASCTCVGESGIGIMENDQAGVLLWPNPTDGRTFFLRIPVDRGRVDIAIADATGRLVHRMTAMGAATPTEVRMPAGIAVGTYVVSIQHAHGAERKALVVGR